MEMEMMMMTMMVIILMIDNNGFDDHPEYLTTLNNAHRSCFYVEIPEKIIE